MDKYLSEIVYGGVDGIITTFAIITGVSGANLPAKIIIIIGLSSILADGFSMGVSSYLSQKMKINPKQNPYLVGIITFLSFVFIGILPLLPFILIKDNSINNKKLDKEVIKKKVKKLKSKRLSLSILIITVLLFILGYLRGSVANAISTVIIGSIASFIAYFIAKQLSKEKNLNN